MNTLPVIAIFFGIVLILGRAPLLLVPASMLGLIRGIVGNIIRIRLMGTIALLIGLCIIVAALTVEKSFPGIVLALGCILAVVAGSLVLIPTSVQKLAIRIWSMSLMQARLLGLVSVLLGAYLIYLGLRFI